MLTIKRIINGRIAENCYIIHNESHCLIIDPGEDFEAITAAITATDTTPAAILLTHTHYDHIESLEQTRARYHVPVYVSPIEQAWLSNPAFNLSANSGNALVAAPAEELLVSHTDYTLGGITFYCVETPGHSPGSVSFVFDNFVVCGDALFKGSMGRTDLYLGNQQQLLQSISTQLFTLPATFAAYPGHGEATTIGTEIATNPYFN
ncbi:MBL fold metallo-hydrolase [Brochothrix campestris]|uniref:Metallo-beta-lactamase domain-containing protein n=1 Tax=Brochothrix campestris FSL F6-1037 TaxID=1265861 RepID=W7D0R9_9LIST|nr:MBL fold metallo-hydrolase [Brochothrix campestris]EUJ41586.1 hypothetical protein BCAMP_03355 [Brochothrix campestris FSL F6-1037]